MLPKKSIFARSAYVAGITLSLITLGCLKESEAVVRTDVDTIVVDGGIDFSSGSSVIVTTLQHQLTFNLLNFRISKHSTLVREHCRHTKESGIGFLDHSTV